MKIAPRAAKMIAAGLAGGLALAVPLHAQRGPGPSQAEVMRSQASPTKGSFPKDAVGATGRAGLVGRMGPIRMSGTGTMNGRPFTVQGAMAPTGNTMAAAGGRDLAGGRPMMVDKPMTMTGAMTMMGRAYRCTMTMTPRGN